uniref:Selenoprotein F n=1 Tax=Nothobranchius furzeri TaxID=105023 RepID=A0A8C6LK02_NOTFU
MGGAAGPSLTYIYMHNNRGCLGLHGTGPKLLQLTQLFPGLLQLLDLVLQEEHGHCERQKRQELQLGRHNESEQPHQIIQRRSRLSVYGAEVTSEACRELGFSSNLLCSSCDLLGEFSLTKLQPTCQRCCQQEAQVEARKLYAGAILEVCG